MGKIKKIILLFVVVMFVSGCMNTVGTAEACDALEKAVKNNKNLENATFETLTQVDTVEEEDLFIQEAVGSFIKTGSSHYDWYYTIFFPGTDRLISQEIVNIAGKQSQKVIIDPLEINDWVPVESPVRSLERLMGGLFETNISEEEIDDMDVKKAETSTTYQVSMKDTYAKESLETTIGELEQQIEDLEESNADVFMIQALKEQVRIHETTTFENYSVTYVVDDEDYLTRVLTETEVARDGIILTLTHVIQLIDYNLADTTGLLPIIE